MKPCRAATIVACMLGSAPLCAQASTPAAVSWEARAVAGWQVQIDRRLLATQPEPTEHALVLLQQMLEGIVRVVPAAAVAELQAVPLHVSPARDGQRSGAEYHPSAAWLRDNGRDPAMARAVEFSGVDDFAKEMRRMPNFALHELAHAYHDRALSRGFANPEVVRAYERAKASGDYDRVERSHGDGRPNTFEPAYARTNAMEYFAECTEAYFTRNDFYPFTRDELERHDPAMFHLLTKLWGVDPVPPTAPARREPADGTGVTLAAIAALLAAAAVGHRLVAARRRRAG